MIGIKIEVIVINTGKGKMVYLIKLDSNDDFLLMLSKRQSLLPTAILFGTTLSKKIRPHEQVLLLTWIQTIYVTHIIRNVETRFTTQDCGLFKKKL